MKRVRLDIHRFAEALVERGVVGFQALEPLVRQSLDDSVPIADLLAREELASDWEFARISSETFRIPFLPVGVYAPASGALEGIDLEWVRRQGILPLDRVGGVCTVSLPGFAPAEALEYLAGTLGETVLPVIGTWASNRRWFEENAPAPGAALPGLAVETPRANRAG